MKKIVFALLLVAACLSSSCDKVSNPFPPALEIDTTIYPGAWSDYVENEWPDFSTMPNEDPERNVLIEDFTGHTCAYCPNAAVIAHDIHVANPDRVFIASIHASNDLQPIRLSSGIQRELILRLRLGLERRIQPDLQGTQQAWSTESMMQDCISLVQFNGRHGQKMLWRHH
jgi:hypothetical protein